MTALARPTQFEDGAAFEGPLFEAFAAVVTRQPDHLAVDDGTTRLLYAEVHDQALALGARIAAVVPEDGLVGVLVPISVLYPVAWLACMAARRPFLPLNPQLPPAQTQAIIAGAGLAAVIVPATVGDLASCVPAALPRIPVAVGPGPATPPLLPGPLLPGRPPSSVGMVIFTSGTTQSAIESAAADASESARSSAIGRAPGHDTGASGHAPGHARGFATGIALHERSLLRRATIDRVTCGLGPDDRFLSLHPPHTSAGVRDVYGALLSGAILYPVDLKRDGLAHALRLLRDVGISVFTMVPAVARALLAVEGAAEAFRDVRIVRLAGDTVMGSDVAALARRLGPTARILVTFGMSEVGIVLERLIDPRAPAETGRIAMGPPPVAGQVVTVESASGDAVNPGETGRLVIRGRYIALGHWVAGRLDPTAFPADPSDPGSRCFRSSDLVLLRPDGLLVPIGRADRQVKINGLRVEPEETEAALRGLPGVADAAVLVHGEAGAPIMIAFVVPVPGGYAGRSNGKNPLPSTARGRAHAPGHASRDWRTALAALLPPHQVPARIRVMTAIPLLPSLKPDLAALRAILAAEVAPGMLARVWKLLRDRVLHRRVDAGAAAAPTRRRGIVTGRLP